MIAKATLKRINH